MWIQSWICKINSNMEYKNRKKAWMLSCHKLNEFTINKIGQVVQVIHAVCNCFYVVSTFSCLGIGVGVMGCGILCRCLLIVRIIKLRVSSSEICWFDRTPSINYFYRLLLIHIVSFASWFFSLLQCKHHSWKGTVNA